MEGVSLHVHEIECLESEHSESWTPRTEKAGCTHMSNEPVLEKKRKEKKVHH
jgi:hypothetical protein